MTITGTEGPNRGKTFPAIYELKDDTLRICDDLSGAWTWPAADSHAVGGKDSLHLGYVDACRTTLGAGVKRGRDNFDSEAGADQPFGEDRVWAGGPEEGASVRFERTGKL